MVSGRRHWHQPVADREQLVEGAAERLLEQIGHLLDREAGVIHRKRNPSANRSRRIAKTSAPLSISSAVASAGVAGLRSVAKTRVALVCPPLRSRAGSPASSAACRCTTSARTKVPPLRPVRRSSTLPAWPSGSNALRSVDRDTANRSAISRSVPSRDPGRSVPWASMDGIRRRTSSAIGPPCDSAMGYGRTASGDS